MFPEYKNSAAMLNIYSIARRFLYIFTYSLGHGAPLMQG